MTKTIKTIKHGEISIANTGKTVTTSYCNRRYTRKLWEAEDGTFWVKTDGQFNEVMFNGYDAWVQPMRGDYGWETRK